MTSRRVILVAVVAVVVFVVDRITKNLVDASIPVGSSVEVVGEWVRIPGGTALLSVLSVVAVFAIVFYYRRLAAGSPLIAVTLGMQLGGAFGNLVDRIGQGHVVDFVDVGIPDGWRFWAFNVADSSIVVGIIAVTVLLWWHERQQPRDVRHA